MLRGMGGADLDQALQTIVNGTTSNPPSGSASKNGCLRTAMIPGPKKSATGGCGERQHVEAYRATVGFAYLILVHRRVRQLECRTERLRVSLRLSSASEPN